MRVCLIMAPYFVPWAPPLGIALLKAHLESGGHQVRCIDWNADPGFWALHLKYIAELESAGEQVCLEGQSRLWSIRNAHLLSVLNGASRAEAARLVRRVTPHYGIECSPALAASLTGIVFRVFDQARTLLDKVDLSGFQVVGTSTFSTSLTMSLFILRVIKSRYPQIRTVMGGGVFADDLAPGSENLQTLLDHYGFVDNVVIGEGELAFSELLEGAFSGRRVISRVELNDRVLPPDDSLAPDFRDFNTDSYYHLTLEGGRSCPFQCAFCSETVQWGPYRKRPQATVARHMAELAERHSIPRFFMGDSLMNPYIEGLSRELLASGAKMQFDGYLRADALAADPQRTANWARAGCYRVRLGIESAAPKVLGMIDKRTTPELTCRALQALSEAGIRTTTYWVVGFPGETEEDFQQTLRFVDENRNMIYEVEAHPFQYFPAGQVGSSQFEPAPLYDDEARALMRFGVWDVAGADPPRPERYRRLRRIAQLAGRLGIRNLYTFRDRWEADKRWMGLHARAVSVY